MSCRRVVLHTAVSLDGFVARLDGSLDWLTCIPDDGSDTSYADFLKTCDTSIMGAKTFEQVRGFIDSDPSIKFPYANLKENLVFTRRSPDQIPTGSLPVQITNKDPVKKVVELLALDSTMDIHLIGGGQLNGQLIKAGLVHKMVLTYIPVILGSGVRLFEGLPDPFTAKFKTISSAVTKYGAVQITLEKSC